MAGNFCWNKSKLKAFVYYVVRPALQEMSCKLNRRAHLQ